MSVHTTLAIESTCDDTSVAIVTQHEGVFHVHAMMTHHQRSHERYGGVVPEAASREHASMLPTIISSMQLEHTPEGLRMPFPLEDSLGLMKQQSDPETSLQFGMRNDSMIKIDSISVAAQPGLPGSIVAGVTAAHMMGAMYEIPVLEVNHIMGHVFSPLLDQNLSTIQFPYLCLTVSGGHSDIYLITDDKKDGSGADASGNDSVRHKRGHYGMGEKITLANLQAIKLCQTSDDAVGEAFDKVAKLLGGPYPGGKWIDDHAKFGKGNIVLAKHLRKIVDKPQFSFSGIKAQVVALLAHLEKNEQELTKELIQDIAWVFQERVIQSLISKIQLMTQEHQPATVGIVGGVSANSLLQQKAKTLEASGAIKDLVFPSRLAYCMDNAAMIAVPALLETL